MIIHEVTLATLLYLWYTMFKVYPENVACSKLAVYWFYGERDINERDLVGNCLFVV